MYRGNFHTVAIIATAVLLSFSFTTAYARFLLTEFISVTLSILLLAEFVKYFKGLRTNSVILFLILASAVYIRYDAVILVTATFLTFALYLRRPKFIKTTIVIGCLFVLVASLTSARHAYNGLEIIPKPRLISDGRPAPEGYINWASLFIFTPEHQEQVLYPLAYFNYNEIIIPSDVNLTEVCRTSSEKLINQLKVYNGKPFPNHIDQISDPRVANSTCSINLHTYLLLELRRAIQMWFPLTASFGWPVTTPNLKAELIKAAHEIAIGNESTKEKLLPLILENFFPITIRALQISIGFFF